MNASRAHPANLLSTLVNCVKAFEFGIYRYKPQVVEDSRKTVCVDSSSLGAFFPAVLKALAADEELAIHSRVYVRSEASVKVFHLPMIDFRWVNLERSGHTILDRVSDFLGERAEVFFSGRSYHLYGLRLLDYAQWVRFMGRLLLLNPPGGPEVVDSRWVGHRLLAGYGALRWSWNSAQYRGMPTFSQRLLPRVLTTGHYGASKQLPLPFWESRGCSAASLTERTEMQPEDDNAWSTLSGREEIARALSARVQSCPVSVAPLRLWP